MNQFSAGGEQSSVSRTEQSWAFRIGQSARLRWRRKESSNLLEGACRFTNLKLTKVHREELPNPNGKQLSELVSS